MDPAGDSFPNDFIVSADKPSVHLSDIYHETVQLTPDTYTFSVYVFPLPFFELQTSNQCSDLCSLNQIKLLAWVTGREVWSSSAGRVDHTVSPLNAVSGLKGLRDRF